ncbi:MAG: FF domain protein, partial [uncultured Sphingomonadaceae bacterium]
GERKHPRRPRHHPARPALQPRRHLPPLVAERRSGGHRLLQRAERHLPQGRGLLRHQRARIPRRHAAAARARDQRLHQAGGDPHARAHRLQPARRRPGLRHLGAGGGRRAWAGADAGAAADRQSRLYHVPGAFHRDHRQRADRRAGAHGGRRPRSGADVALARGGGDRAQGRRLRRVAPRHARLEPLAPVEDQVAGDGGGHRQFSEEPRQGHAGAAAAGRARGARREVALVPLRLRPPGDGAQGGGPVVRLLPPRLPPVATRRPRADPRVREPIRGRDHARAAAGRRAGGGVRL